MIDFVSDLHWDNALSGGPFGWMGTLGVSRLRNEGSTVLVVAGDTAENQSDAVDFLNCARPCYEVVVGILGNHEKRNASPVRAEGVVLLDEDGPFSRDGVAFHGGELKVVPDSFLDELESSFSDPDVRSVVVVCHHVPSRNVLFLGRDLSEHRNDLIEKMISRFGEAPKPTTVIFGHIHIEVDQIDRGYRLLSMPRGYRGLRRDGSAFKRFGQFRCV